MNTRLTKRVNDVVVYIGKEARWKDTGDTACEMSINDVKEIMNKLCDYEDEHEKDYVTSPTTLNKINGFLNWTCITDTTKRLAELDKLATEIEIVSSYTLEQLLDLFLSGYTLKAPEHKDFRRGI